MFFVLASSQMKYCRDCLEYHFGDEPCREPTEEETVELEQEMADACSRCNGRGTPWGCKSCGKKVPETSCH